MKKPINKFAVVLWLVALAVTVGDAMYFILPQPTFTPSASGSLLDTYYDVSYWMGIRTTIVSASIPAALGVLIELIDQIRWNALQPPK